MDMKRILALTGAVLLVSLYILTLISAIIDSPFFRDLFRASVAATIIVPILIFVIRWIRNVLKLYTDPGSSSGENGSEKK